MDVRPKITDLSVTTELTGEVITLNGFNFYDALPNFAVVFTEDGGTVNGTLGTVTGTTIDVTIPDTAISGPVYVEENTPTIQSNSLDLEVWKKYDYVVGTSAGSGQDITASGTGSSFVFNANDGFKSIYYSKDGAAAINIDSLAVDLEGPSITSNTSNVYIAYAPSKTDNFSITTVAYKGGDDGLYTDIAIDGSDNPYIAYADNSSGSALLKYAYHDGAIWNIVSPPASITDIMLKEKVSISVGSNDYIYIGYIDDALVAHQLIIYP